MARPIAIWACAAGLALALLAGCGDDETETVTETRTVPGGTTEVETGATTEAETAPEGDHGPQYFQTPSRNIGCYLDRSAVRCDIRERDWSPPPKPASCRKYGGDWGQGISVGGGAAEFVCATDTSLGGPGTLAYGESARRGPFLCESEESGITCRNTDTGRGFFLSRQSYRIL